MYRTWQEIKSLNAKAVDYAKRSFYAQQVIIVPSFGNNDIYPHNTLDYNTNTNEILDFYSVLWSPFIPKSQVAQFRRGGW